MANVQLPVVALSAVNLSTGATHYELTGPEDGPLVVLLHGATIPMWIWDCQVPALIQAGFRVLRYDMFGKGKSACPAVNYDRHLFCNQLHDLISRNLLIHRVREWDQGAVLAWGSFLTLTLNFAIVAFVLFLVIRAMNTFKRKEEAAPAAPPKPTAEVALLTEIRDLLKKS